MMFISRFKKSIPGVLVLTALTMYAATAFADLTFTAPPRESALKGEKMYAPIAKHLSELLGETVTYEHPGGWFEYSANMRDNKYDIIFDGPHFAAWRIKNLDHQPVAKLPGTLDFYILVKADDEKINDLRDLVSHKVCGLASPNLGTVTVYSLYDNPVVQPEVHEVKGGFKGVFKAFRDNKCRAAVVRDNIYKKLKDSDKEEIKVIYKSRSLPNQTVTVSKNIDAKTRELIAYGLTTPQGFKSADGLFGRFSKKAKYFIPPKQKEYRGLDNLLSGVVWGW